MKIKIVLFICLLLWGCSYKEKLIIGGVDVSKGDMISMKDTHGGFHGDGVSFMEMSFDDCSTEYDIKRNPKWRKLSLSDDLEAIVYGVNKSDEHIGPYITDDNGNSLFPMVKNGYYYFNKRNDNGYSLNIDIAIYDEDTRKLYYCEFDT